MAALETAQSSPHLFEGVNNASAAAAKPVSMGAAHVCAHVQPLEKTVKES